MFEELKYVPMSKYQHFLTKIWRIKDVFFFIFVHFPLRIFISFTHICRWYAQYIHYFGEKHIKFATKLKNLLAILNPLLPPYLVISDCSLNLPISSSHFLLSIDHARAASAVRFIRMMPCVFTP